MPNNSNLLMLNATWVASFLQPEDVLAAVREAFTLHSEEKGRVFPVIREKLSTGGIFGIKAGDVQSEGLLGFKAAGFWPTNRALGGEPHQATIMLVDPETGRPVCIIDGNAITTARTGAAGALGLELLAPKEATKLCVFGTGVQAAAQLSYALNVLPNIKIVRYVSVDRQPSEFFERQFANLVAVESAADADAAVADSDVVITATPGSAPLFSSAAVRTGTHFNCVGADTKGKRELPEGVLPQAKIFVDDITQAKQIGENQWAPELSCTELGDLLTGNATFNRKSLDVTVFDMTGLALQDLTVARLIYAKAMESGAGQQVAWPW